MLPRIHKLSDVASKNIGHNTVIWQFTVVLEGAKIGENCNINCNCFVENDVWIGNNVTIKSGVQVWDGIVIGNNVFVGPNVTFTNDQLARSKKYPVLYLKTIVSENASIGANSTILPGINIGEYAFIGAGSVVTKDVAPFTIMAGNPCRIVGYITRDDVRLGLNLVDKLTGNQYHFSENGEPVKTET